MASGQYIFSIYQTSGALFFVLRTVRPEFNNAYQTQDDQSWERESAQRDELLAHIGNRHEQKVFALVGELHGFPIGDVFYGEFGQPGVPVYYMKTDFGEPWLVFGSANSEREFLAELAQDEDLLALHPIGNPTRIDACFVTQNDLAKTH